MIAKLEASIGSDSQTKLRIILGIFTVIIIGGFSLWNITLELEVM
jgi:hypothetical protein